MDGHPWLGGGLYYVRAEYALPTEKRKCCDSLLRPDISYLPLPPHYEFGLLNIPVCAYIHTKYRSEPHLYIAELSDLEYENR